MHAEQRGDDIIIGPARIEPWVEPVTIRCPKCDQDCRCIGVNYCRGNMDPMFAEHLCFGRPEEHLHVGCQRCNYVWLMETKAEAEKRIEASARSKGIVPATTAEMPPLGMKHISEVMSNFTFLQPAPQPRKE